MVGNCFEDHLQATIERGLFASYTAARPLGLFQSRMSLSLFLASGRSASVFFPIHFPCPHRRPRTLNSPSILHSLHLINVLHHAYLTYLLRSVTGLVFIHWSEFLKLCSRRTLVYQSRVSLVRQWSRWRFHCFWSPDRPKTEDQSGCSD